MTLSRRDALRLAPAGLAGSLAGSLTACGTPTLESFTSPSQILTGRFAHGVASGDPASDSVVLWTRVSPTGDGPISVGWEISETADFAGVRTGVIETSAARDFTVKAVPEGLSPGRSYFFRFRTADAVSPTGRTRTLPVGATDRLHMAVVSCANWQHGYFNTYDAIARRGEADPYDLVVHLGDYFYEYGPEDYLDGEAIPDRRHEPPHEIVSLSDYRIRHAQYRTDPALQAAAACAPWITVWDDHESANDSWQGGAQNHQDDEGAWDRRKADAMRAYYEWMPIREADKRAELFRDFRFGDLLDLVAVETRLLARSEQIEPTDYVEAIVADADGFKRDRLNDPSREMFGRAQENFIVDSLAQSKADGVAWRMLANQVIMGRMLTPDLTPYVDPEAVTRIERDWAGIRDFVTLSRYNLPVYPDSWDGYPAARERFYAALQARGVTDIVVLTGDAHEFWANDLTDEAGIKMGAELVTTSVSSKTLTAYLGDNTADYSLLLTQKNADPRYYNALHNGFTDLVVSRKTIRAEMVGVSTVKSRDYQAFRVAGFTLRPSKGSVKIAGPRGLNFKQRLLFSNIGK